MAGGGGEKSGVLSFPLGLCRFFLVKCFSTCFGLALQCVPCPLGSNMNHSSSSSSMTAEEGTKGVAVEKIEQVKKWSLNTYKVCTSG